MPNGFGYAVSGKPDARAAKVLAGRTAPGADATKQVEAAIAAVRALAASAGHVLPNGDSGGSSKTRDRMTIAADALAPGRRARGDRLLAQDAHAHDRVAVRFGHADLSELRS